MANEQFSLVWNSFPRNLSSGLYSLLTDEHLVDVTLAAEGQILRAHKLILSVCSSYFRDLFKGNSCKHPIVILKDVNYRDLSAMLHFMYQGEVNIKQEDIASFLKVAETLQIKGLTRENGELGEKFRTEVEDLDGLLQLGKFAKNAELDENPSVEKATDKETNASEETSENPATNVHTDLVEPAMMEDTIVDQREDTVEPEDLDMNCMFEKNDRGNESIERSGDEPLDCTQGVPHNWRTKSEPLDYSYDMDGYSMPKDLMNPQEENLSRQDFPMDTHLMPYNPSIPDQSIASSNNPGGGLQSDYPYDILGFNKGRRTVKGLPNSALPLETTLRVVSELGPTLRVERGKVIRMFSCPWCLRHFTRKENLKLHVRYIHGPLESLTCKLCGNKYKNSNSLRVHSYLYHNAKRDKHGKPLVPGTI